MKKVMILGAGRGQIPIMELCRKYGSEIIVVTPHGNYPGISFADKVFYEDVRNKENVLSIAKRESINAILTDQLDAGVLTAAYVSEKMGLKGITVETALKFTNKYVMRETAKGSGISIPKCFCISSLEEAITIIDNDRNFNYPLMIKPVDSAASRGVYKIISFEDLQEKFEVSKSYSNSGKVILEQFIVGKEYVVEAFTSDYQVKNLVVGHRDYFGIPDTFIPNATVFVDADSATSHIEEKLKATNECLIKYFGLKFGITHAEYLYVAETDTVYLVEIAARGGGVFISSDLIPTACGVNANDLLVREVLEIPNDNTIELKRGASAYFCYLTPEGEITTIENTKEVEKIVGVHKAFFDNVEVGMRTKSICDKSSRKGPILVKGKTKQDCYEIIKRVINSFNIKVKTEKGIEDIIWH